MTCLLTILTTSIHKINVHGGMDMSAEEFYQVHTTNLNRPPNVSTLTPRKSINAPPPGRPNPRRSPRPIYLPANIYKLLSDVAIKEPKKHNATTRSTPPPKRAVNTHDTDPHPEHPPTDTPTGAPTPPESPADPDLDNTEPCEAITFDDSTLEHLMDSYSPSYSVNKTHINHVSKHSSSHYGSLIDRGPMVALLPQMLEFWKGLAELSLSLALATMNSQALTLLPVLPSSIPIMVK